MFKLSKPVLYALIAAVFAVVYLLTTPPETPKVAKKKKTPPIVTAKASQYREEDMTAAFPVLAGNTKNSFKPLVARSESGGEAGAPGSENALPAAFADGDGNWVCTGFAEDNGVRMALLENKTTGEGVFVKVGERWKRTLLVDIKDDKAIFVGPNGDSRAVPIQTEDPKKFEPAKVENPPAMQGPIGRPNFQLPPGMSFGGGGGGETVITFGGE